MIPLTVRSHYSLMWGTDSPAAICRSARQMGYDRIALTDTDNLCGLWKFLHACHEEGLTPIVGAEITDPSQNHRAVCLVKDPAGYANLCRLITRRHRDPAFALSSALPPLAGGLLVLTSRADLLAAWHRAGVHTAAALPRRPPSPFHPLVQAARRLGITLVATPASFFPQPDGFAVHRLLRAIAGNTALSRLNPGDTAPADAWLATPEEYRRRFNSCREAVDNTMHMADELKFTGPDFGLVMPPWKAKDTSSADNSLRRAAYAGARNRYGRELGEAVVDRLEHELAVIARMGFSAYFMVVKKIVSQSPRTCGRGSAAASLVAYSLGITNVCPVKHNLYFGRFLNPGRSDPPDIDVDFAWDERDTVIDGVLDRFAGHAAMVASHILFQPRMALRETAKVFGMPAGKSAGSPGACPGSGIGGAGCRPAGQPATASGNPPPGFHRPLAADRSTGPADHRDSTAPLRAPRRCGRHPGSHRRLRSRGNGPQRGARHPVGQGRRRGRRAGEDRPSGKPQPGGDP
jgi:error-prone DNA polymerase